MPRRYLASTKPLRKKRANTFLGDTADALGFDKGVVRGMDNMSALSSIIPFANVITSALDLGYDLRRFANDDEIGMTRTDHATNALLDAAGFIPAVKALRFDLFKKPEFTWKYLLSRLRKYSNYVNGTTNVLKAADAINDSHASPEDIQTNKFVKFPKR